jgi:hypothetical protein
VQESAMIHLDGIGQDDRGRREHEDGHDC